MSAHLFQEGIKKLAVEHEFIPVKTPNKNAHIESFFSIYDLHLQEQYFWNLRDAYHWTLEFMDFYNKQRIHGSLGMSPEEFAKKKDLHGLEKFSQAI
jgi:putative transposase